MLFHVSYPYLIFMIICFLSDNGRFTSEVPNSHKNSDESNNPERSIKLQSSTIKSSTSRIQTSIGNISESLTVGKNLS